MAASDETFPIHLNTDTITTLHAVMKLTLLKLNSCLIIAHIFSFLFLLCFPFFYS